MKKLMLGLMMAFAATAEARVTIDGFEYELDTQNKTAQLVKYDRGKPKPTKVDIGTVKYEDVTYTVVSVARQALGNCSDLTSVSLPYVTEIGGYAFNYCTSLTSVSLPSATKIEEYVFSHCESLTSISLPNVTFVGEGAFVGCKNLIGISLPSATEIDEYAFYNCTSLTKISLPYATSIGQHAFKGVPLSVLVVNADMKSEIEKTGVGYYEIPENATIEVFEPLPEDVVRATGYGLQISPIVKNGDTVLDEVDYLASCKKYGITPQTKPTVDDYKIVSKDAQVVQEDEIAVKKTELQAAKAEAVSVADGVVTLGVTVNTNDNFTAETKDWKPVELKQENVKVENGKIVISIPVSDKSGFMILQSGDANVPAERLDSMWGVLVVD